MKELLEEAVAFLKEHPEINEVELSDIRGKVHLIRDFYRPIPTVKVSDFYGSSGYSGQGTV